MLGQQNNSTSLQMQRLPKAIVQKEMDRRSFLKCNQTLGHTLTHGRALLKILTCRILIQQ